MMGGGVGVGSLSRIWVLLDSLKGLRAADGGGLCSELRTRVGLPDRGGVLRDTGGAYEARCEREGVGLVAPRLRVSLA